MDELHLIVSLGRQLDFIPNDLIGLVRQTFSIVYQTVLANPTETNWKKVIILPVVLFTDFHCDRRSTLRHTCQLIAEDTWPFAVRDFPGKQPSQHRHKKKSPEDARMRLVKHLIGKGEGSRAFKVLMSDTHRAPHSQAILDTLRAKFPQPVIDTPWLPSAMDTDPAVEHHIEPLTGKLVLNIIRSLPNSTAPGVDCFPIDILKALTSNRHKADVPQEVLTFCELFASVCYAVYISDSTPASVRDFFDSSELVPLQVNLYKVRPIGKSTLMRKIFDKHTIKVTHSKVAVDFSGIQYAGAPFGPERVKHAMCAAHQKNPHFDASYSDCADAFQNVSRHQILNQTESTIPELLAFQRQRLGTTQHQVYIGAPEGPTEITAREGVSQGGPRSLIDHGLGTLALNRSLDEIVKPHGGRVEAYADDVEALGPSAALREVVSRQVVDGPKFGQPLRLEKHRILLGRKDSTALAEQEREAYIAIGIPAQRICLHPDNDTASAGLYGHTHLGIPVGSPQYIANQVNALCNQIEQEFSLLTERCKDEKQLFFYFLSHIMPCKLTYLLRGLPPVHTRGVAQAFDKAQRTALANILDVPNLSDAQYTIACSPIGADLPCALDLCDAAFVASVTAAIPDITDLVPSFSQEVLDCSAGQPASCEYVSEYASAIERLHQGDKAITVADILATRAGDLKHLQRNLSKSRKAVRTHKANELAFQADSELRARFASGRDDDARVWLNLVPKHDGVRLTNAEFSTALRSRLLVPHPYIPLGATCVCARAPPLDPYGSHLVKCPTLNDLTIGTHDALRDELKQFLICSGVDCKTEVRNVFIPEGETPDLRRLDLVVNIPGEPQQLYDVTVVSPTQWDPGPSQDPLLAAERKKSAKYGADAQKAGRVFTPLVFEHGGRRAPQCKRFFDQTVSRYAANTGASKDAIRGYWDRRLNVALQRGLARAIIQRAHRVSCRALASNRAAASEIQDTQQGHPPLGTAPPLSLDPLHDRSWDYTESAGTGSGCWSVNKEE